MATILFYSLNNSLLITSFQGCTRDSGHTVLQSELKLKAFITEKLVSKLCSIFDLLAFWSPLTSPKCPSCYIPYLTEKVSHPKVPKLEPCP